MATTLINSGKQEISTPKFTPPQKLESLENESPCSSPSASGFIIMASQKPSADARKQSAASTSKVFSDDDVIVLLKGLSIFWENGKNNKWTDFHKFIQDNLECSFTRVQVSEKIRCLKKKFFSNLERAQLNSLDLSDPHESAVFELSKALWGDEPHIAMSKAEDGDHDEGTKKKKKKKRKDDQDEHLIEVNKKKSKRGLIEDGGDENPIEANTNTNLVEDGPEETKINNKTKKKDRGEGDADKMKISYDVFESSYPLLCASFDTMHPMVAKENIAMIGRDEAQELEKMWRKWKTDKLNFELKKLQFLKRKAGELGDSSTD